MLFSDAVHFLHNVHQSYYWSKKGQRPSFKANAGRNRYNVLGGYTTGKSKYVGVNTIGTVNAQTVIEWIDAIEKAFPDPPCITVYVDNARYFHAKMVKAHLLEKRVRFIYLPPYSPNLNIIERLWKFCKKKVLSKYYETFAVFQKAIEEFFTNLGQYKAELETLLTDNFEKINCR